MRNNERKEFDDEDCVEKNSARGAPPMKFIETAAQITSSAGD